MAFVLTEEQQMLRDAAVDFAADKLPTTALRALRDGASNAGFNPDTWEEMAQMGWTGVLVPEAYGGSDFGYTGLGQILEAQGATLAATPLLQTALVGVAALTLAGSEAQKQAYLPKIAEGALKAALAVDEGAHHSPAQIALKAEKSADGWTLSGEKRYVLDGSHAELFILAARTSGAPGQTTGLTLFLIPSDTAGVDLTPLTTVDAHAAANISLDGVKLGDDAVLGPVDGGWDVLEPLLDRARIGLACEMLGACDAAFEMTKDYLQTRKQFGQLIGSFQSLQHRAAIMFSEIELTRSCIAAALEALDQNANNIAELASLAKAKAADTIHLVSNETVQMHGGIGMTDDHDAGLYMKRARVLETIYGGASFHRDRYAALNGF